MPTGGHFLDDHATPGYSRLTTAHWQASDSPGELLKIVGITDHRFGPPLPMSDGDVTRSSATADGHTMFSNSCQLLHNCRNCRNKLCFKLIILCLGLGLGSCWYSWLTFSTPKINPNTQPNSNLLNYIFIYQSVPSSTLILTVLYIFVLILHTMSQLFDSIDNTVCFSCLTR